MNTAYLLLGSNIGKREAYLSEAISLINEKAGKIISKSSVYETKAWGNTQQEDFLNQAVCVQTAMNPAQLMQTILGIEEEMGRTRSRKWEPRSIDIDILFYHQMIIRTENLSVPHPHLHERKFALAPLNEIAPDFVHPILKKTVSKLLSECSDNLLVKKI